MIENLILDNKIDKYIIRLIIFVNNYHKYDNNYIKDKYNIDSHNNFIKYFKKNYKKKILFSSNESEQLFINLINIDIDFMFKKYNSDMISKLIYFFIARKKINFNYCNYINKHEKQLCTCKIKVKSIVNLSIESFIFILRQYVKNNNKTNNEKNNTNITNNTNNTNSNLYKFINEKLNINDTNNIFNNNDSNSNDLQSKYYSEKSINLSNGTKSKSTKNIVKIKKNQNSENIIKCFNNLEKANNILGYGDIENHYTLDSNSELNNTNLLIDNTNNSSKKNINKSNTTIYSNNIDIFDSLESYDLDNTNNFDKYLTGYKNNNNNQNKKNLKIFYNSQFSSESVNPSCDFSEQNKYVEVNKKNKSLIQDKQKNNNNIDTDIITKQDLSNILQKEKIDKIKILDESNKLSKLDKESNYDKESTNSNTSNNSSNSSSNNSSNSSSNNSSNNSSNSSNKSNNTNKCKELISNEPKKSSNDSESSLEELKNSLEESKSSLEESISSPNDIIKISEALESEIYLNLKNKKIVKDNIKSYIDLIINYLKINNNILIDEKLDIGKLAIELKKNIRNKYSNEIASKFDRLFQKIILVKTISDTDDMNNYYDLINQLNDYKKLL